MTDNDYLSRVYQRGRERDAFWSGVIVTIGIFSAIVAVINMISGSGE